jgi:hypothetical protein
MYRLKNRIAALGITAAAALVVMAAASLLLLPASARACDDCESAFKPGTYTGEAKRIGNGVAYSWVTLNDKGKPSAIGVTLTETALEGLPETFENGMPMLALDLGLPKQAMKTAFDHIGLDWNPKGHDPLGVYDKPHFDVHFYMIPVEARMKITGVGADLKRCETPVPAAFAPSGYILAPGTAVPMMGSHWVDPKAPELNGQPFTKTFLYGSYDGKMAFYEPMLTSAWLSTKPNLRESIAVPKSYTKSAYYPTAYSVKYDPARREYTIALEGMTWQEAAATAAPAKPAKPADVAKKQKPAAKPAAKAAVRRSARNR